MSPQLQTSWLNKTPHKTPRDTTTFTPAFVVAHETGGFGTLAWNVRPEAQASFNYLILRDGTTHWYVDETRFIAWHAGVGPKRAPYYGIARHTIGNRLFYLDRNAGRTVSAVNMHSIGVEFEGPNSGQPITAAQKRAFIELAIYFRDRYGIPIDPAYYPEHKDVAPEYKHDGMGFDIKELIRMAVDAVQSTERGDRRVLGTLPSVTSKQVIDSLTRNNAPFSADEMKRIPVLLQWNDIDPAFAIAMMKRESDFGKQPLQRKTNNLFNIKAEAGDDRARYKDEQGRVWLAYESPWIALQDWVVHMKQEYGAKGLLTVRQIIPVYAPASDQNDVEKYINDVLLDMKWIREH